MFKDLRLFAERRICPYMAEVAHAKGHKICTRIGYSIYIFLFYPLSVLSWWLVWCTIIHKSRIFLHSNKNVYQFNITFFFFFFFLTINYPKSFFMASALYTFLYIHLAYSKLLLYVVKQSFYINEIVHYYVYGVNKVSGFKFYI